MTFNKVSTTIMFFFIVVTDITYNQLVDRPEPKRNIAGGFRYILHGHISAYISKCIKMIFGDFKYVLPEFHPEHICENHLVKILLPETPQIKLKVLYSLSNYHCY